MLHLLFRVKGAFSLFHCTYSSSFLTVSFSADAKAQSTVAGEFLMNDTTESLASSHSTTAQHDSSSKSSSSSTHIRSHLGVAATLMSNETDLESVVLSSNVDIDSASLTPPKDDTVATMVVTTGSALEQLNQIVSEAQPLVMTTTTESQQLAATVSEPMNIGSASVELSGRNEVTNSSTVKPCKYH